MHNEAGEGGGREGLQGKNEMLLDVGGDGSECSRRPIIIFFIKEKWICVMTRHHAKPNINMLLTRNLHFNSDVRR